MTHRAAGLLLTLLGMGGLLSRPDGPLQVPLLLITAACLGLGVALLLGSLWHKRKHEPSVKAKPAQSQALEAGEASPCNSCEG